MKNKKDKRIKLTAEPNSSLNNKTGSWRTYKPTTNYDTCIGCATCSKVCPEGCIVMKKKGNKNIPVTDYDYCKGCGVCASECPVKAIIMEKDF